MTKTKRQTLQRQKTQPTHRYVRDTLISSFICVELGAVDFVGAVVVAEELGFAELGTCLDSIGSKWQALQTAGLEEEDTDLN